MGKYYYKYECTNCNKRWGTDKTGDMVPMACEQCHQFSTPISSRPAIHSEYHCRCGYRWKCSRRRFIKCRRCGVTVPPDDMAMNQSYDETESESDSCWKYKGEKKKKPQWEYVEQTPSDRTTTGWQSPDEERRKPGVENQRYSEQKQNGSALNGVRSEVTNHFSRGFENVRGRSPEQNHQSPYTSQSRTTSKHDRNMGQKAQQSDFFFNEGNRYFMEAKYELAVESFTKAIELSSGDAAYFRNRSQAFMKLGRMSEAQYDMKCSTQCPSNDVRPHHVNVADDTLANLQQTAENLRLTDRTRHLTEDSGYQDKPVSPLSAPTHHAGDARGLNVVIMEGLYRNKFEPVKLSELLGVKFDNETLQSIVEKELPSAVQKNNVMAFSQSTGLCYVSRIPEICNNEAICGRSCDVWHICKRFLLGCCPYVGYSCKMNHDLFHHKNSPLLSKNGLYGIDEQIMKALMLSQHRPDFLRPQMCVGYCNSQCRTYGCRRLHICTNFMLGNCRCPRSHDLYDRHNKCALDYFNVDMDGICSREEVAERIRLWNPNVKGPSIPSRPHVTSPDIERRSLMTSPSWERPSSVTSPSWERPSSVTSPSWGRPSSVTSPRTNGPSSVTSPRTNGPSAVTSPRTNGPSSVTSPSSQETIDFPGPNLKSYDVQTEIRDHPVSGRYLHDDNEISWDTATSAAARAAPSTARTTAAAARTKLAAVMTPAAPAAARTSSAPPYMNLESTRKPSAATWTTPAAAWTPTSTAGASHRAQPAAAETSAVWQYNLYDNGERHFPLDDQLELELALCDVQEKKIITIEGREVTVNLNEVATEGVDHVTRGVLTVTRTGLHDQWTWFYGTSLYGKWRKIVGEGDRDIQPVIEWSYQKYKAGHSGTKLKVDVKSIGWVELDFEKWFVEDTQRTCVLDIRRRPARSEFP